MTEKVGIFWKKRSFLIIAKLSYKYIKKLKVKRQFGSKFVENAENGFYFIHKTIFLIQKLK